MTWDPGRKRRPVLGLIQALMIIVALFAAFALALDGRKLSAVGLMLAVVLVPGLIRLALVPLRVAWGKAAAMLGWTLSKELGPGELVRADAGGMMVQVIKRPDDKHVELRMA